jgi:hypothetical protein
VGCLTSLQIFDVPYVLAECRSATRWALDVERISSGLVERAVLAELEPPLNLKGMSDSPLRRHLQELRKIVAVYPVAVPANVTAKNDHRVMSAEVMRPSGADTFERSSVAMLKGVPPLVTGLFSCASIWLILPGVILIIRSAVPLARVQIRAVKANIAYASEQRRRTAHPDWFISHLTALDDEYE